MKKNGLRRVLILFCAVCSLYIMVSNLFKPILYSHTYKENLVTKLKKSYEYLQDGFSIAENFENIPNSKKIDKIRYFYYFLEDEDNKDFSKANYYNKSAVVLENGSMIFNYVLYKNEHIDKGLCKALGNENGKYIAKFDLDVNGISEPNVFGRDIFRFIVRNDGNVIPYRGSDINTNCTKNILPIFNNNEHKGLICAAKIISDGWMMKY